MLKKTIILTATLMCFQFTLLFAQATEINTAENLFGKWETKVNEPVDGKCKIKVNWKSDFTTEIVFVHKNGLTTTSSSKWKYNHPDYIEVFPDGSVGKAKIEWINKNKFVLTIVQNQDTENYLGRKRVYVRKK